MEAVENGGMPSFNRTRRRRSAISLWATVLLLLSFWPVQITGMELEGHWAESTLKRWIEAGKIKGYPDGTIRPDHWITRAEFVALTNRIPKIALPDSGTEATFRDVSEGSWYYGDISTAAGGGYITGYEDGSFRPNRQISRQVAAVVLYRILNQDAGPSASIESFRDSEAVPEWSRDALASLVFIGILQGYEDMTLRPQRPVSRAEIVTMLDRLEERLAGGTVPREEAEKLEPRLSEIIIYGSAQVGGTVETAFTYEGFDGDGKPWWPEIRWFVSDRPDGTEAKVIDGEVLRYLVLTDQYVNKYVFAEVKIVSNEKEGEPRRSETIGPINNE